MKTLYVIILVVLYAHAYCIGPYDRSDDCLQKGVHAPKGNINAIESMQYKPISQPTYTSQQNYAAPQIHTPTPSQPRDVGIWGRAFADPLFHHLLLIQSGRHMILKMLKFIVLGAYFSIGICLFFSII